MPFESVMVWPFAWGQRLAEGTPVEEETVLDETELDETELEDAEFDDAELERAEVTVLDELVAVCFKNPEM